MKSLVFVDNNRVVTDSLTVAGVFGKEHNKVLRDIRELECSEQFRLSNFGQSTYTNKQGREMPKYLMTKDGFTLLAFGYTGSLATRFKEAYIKEFNRMQEQLHRPMSQLEILQASINQLVEQDKRIKALEVRQENMAQIIELNPTEWRKKVNRLISKIARKLGGDGMYEQVRNESYESLEERAHCNLSIRLTNMKKQMALEGAPKSKIKSKNKMDVIANDSRLTEIYLAIVKEMAIRYQIEGAS